MSKLAMTALSLSLLVPPALGRDGMIALPCVHSSKASMDRLEDIARARGLKIFARIDHAAGAKSIGMALRPTELLIFGHPRGGTPLLKCSQTYGIDLPMRVLEWEDESGNSWMGYSDPAALGDRHTQTECDAILRKLTVVLDELVRQAASDQTNRKGNQP